MYRPLGGATWALVKIEQMLKTCFFFLFNKTNVRMYLRTSIWDHLGIYDDTRTRCQLYGRGWVSLRAFAH